MRRPATAPSDRRPRRRTIGVVVGVVLLAATACSARTGSTVAQVTGGNCAGSPKPPVKISVVTDLSGPSPVLVSHGKATVAAATTAAHLANTSGGINCAPVQLVVHDGAGSSAGVIQAVREAISDRPAAVTGFEITGFLAGSVPLINQAKIPWMSTSPSFQGVAAIPYFYSTQPANGVLGADAAEALKRELGGSLAGKKIAFDGSTNSAAVDEMLAALTAAVAADGGSVGPVLRDPTVVTDWSSQAANVVAADVDAVATVGGVDSTVITVTQGLRTANFGGKVLSILSVTDSALQKIDSESFVNMRNVVFPQPGSSLAAAVQDAGASVHDANASAYFGQEFAAATALTDTLRRCGDACTVDRFSRTVSEFGPYTVPLNALLGPMSFAPRVATMPTGLFRWDRSVNKVSAVGSPS